MAFPTFEKDPGATLDYAFDWRPWLATGETITAHSVTAATGITLDSEGEDPAGVITVWLSGGDAGVKYNVTCQVTTSEQRVDERTISIKVKQR